MSGELVRIPGASPAAAAPSGPTAAERLRDLRVLGAGAALVVVALLAGGIVPALVLAVLISVVAVLAGRSRPTAIPDAASPDDPRAQVLLGRPHRGIDDLAEGAYPRFAAEVTVDGDRPAVRLLRFDPAGPGQFRMTVEERRTFMLGADPEQVRELGRTFAARARDREFEAYAATQSTQDESARLEQRTHELAEVARQSVSGADDSPESALAGRRHAADYPGLKHMAYCVQLGTDAEGNPNIKLLRWNPAFPGRPERTEMAVERDRSFAADDVVGYTSVATQWAIDAQQLEATAYKPIAEKLAAAEAEQMRALAEAELERQRREDAQNTIDAARRALGD